MYKKNENYIEKQSKAQSIHGLSLEQQFASLPVFMRIAAQSDPGASNTDALRKPDKTSVYDAQGPLQRPYETPFAFNSTM